MNKWDDLRWSEMREALSGLIINFERLSQISSRSFSFEAKEEIPGRFKTVHPRRFQLEKTSFERGKSIMPEDSQ